MRTPLLAFIFILMGIKAHTQIKITGKITDIYQSELPDVHIRLNEKEYFSDINGNFQLKNLPEGNHNLIFDLAGFETLDTIVSVQQDLVLDISLKPEITLLNEAKIEHVSTDLEKTISAHTLNQNKIERYTNKSLGEALLEIEGVNALKTGNNVVKPIINGLHSSRVPVFSNEIRLEDQEWGTEHAPNVDINSATDIQVIKGTNALQYGGDAVGGIVLINSKTPPKKDTIYGKTLLSASSNGRGGSLSTSLTKGYKNGWFWNTTLTGKFMGDLHSSDYNLSNTGNYEQNFSVRAGFKKLNNGIWLSYSLYNTQNGILKASHIGNLNDLVKAINSRQPYYISDFNYELENPKQNVTHHLLQLNAFQKFENIGKLDLQYAFQLNNRKEFDIRRGEYADIPALDLALSTQTLNVGFESLKFNSLKFKTGVNALYQVNKPNAKTNIRPLIPDYKRTDFGIYALANFEPNPVFALSTGLRYDYSRVNAQKYYLISRWEERGYAEEFPEFEIENFGNQILTNPQFTFNNLSASVGFNYHPRHDRDFYFNANYIIRNPNPSELFSDGLHHSTATIELGDLRLNQEKALKFSVTASQHSDSFSIDISPHLNFINDFIQLVPAGLEYTVRGAFPSWNYRQNNALIWGIDANAEWRYNSKFSQRFAASYIYGQDTDAGEPLVNMPPFNISNMISYDLENWHGLEISLKNTIYFTKKRYPDNNFTTDLIINGGTTPTYVNISTPPKGYNLFDLFISSDLGSVLGWTKNKFTFNFNIENIFNTRYRNYLNQQRFYADEIGRNFNIQLKINY